MRSPHKLHCWHNDAQDVADVAFRVANGAEPDIDMTASQVCDCQARWRAVHGQQVQVDVAAIDTPLVTPRNPLNVAAATRGEALDTPPKAKREDARAAKVVDCAHTPVDAVADGHGDLGKGTISRGIGVDPGMNILLIAAIGLTDGTNEVTSETEGRGAGTPILPMKSKKAATP